MVRETHAGGSGAPPGSEYPFSHVVPPIGPAGPRAARRNANASWRLAPLGPLAPRERQIAAEVGRGLRNREIADALAMSEGTVKVYLHTIYQKLGIKNRTELALIAHVVESGTTT